MIFDTEKLVPLCESFGLSLEKEALERLEIYGNLLVEYNKNVNLTAITDCEGVLYKHFYDCLLFFKNADVKEGARIIDVGTGAGFPGLVLKIARNDLDITLLDALDKRINFLRAVLDKTGLTAELIHSRAEDGGKSPDLREQFDIACARAVANLPVLSELCIPYVKKGGYFISMKGESGQQEAEAAENAFSLLGCEKPNVFYENLPLGDKRTFIIAKKISQTPTKYPRNFGKIKKSPL